MAHKLNGTPKKALADRDKDILNDNVSTSGKDNHNHNEGCESESEENKVPECAVCLQTCIHPVKLPCNHIFCFLCVKGVANQSKRCALCRHEIPMDFLNNPALLRRQDLMKDTGFADGFQWYYEGRNGWWQYDERTSTELEDRLKRSVKAFEILIAGFLYVIDLDAMVQIRRNDPTRRRRIKRDLSTIPKKGVAGLKTTDDECEEEDGEGEEGNTTTAVRVAGEGGDTDADGGGGGDGGGVAHHRRVVALGTPHHHHHPTTTTTNTGSHHSSPHHGNQHLHPQSAVPSVLGDNHHVLLNTMSNLSVSLPTGGSPQHVVGVGYAGSPRRSPSRGAPGSGSRPTSREHSPSPLNPPPMNTPQSPENPSEAGTPDSVTEEMNRNMEELALTHSGRYRHMHRHGRRRNRNRTSRHYDATGRPRIHLLDTSSSSSDSDWDYWY